MKRRMKINIEVRGHGDGEYQAYCAELGLSCSGRSLEDVLDRMKGLLAFYCSAIEEADLPAEEEVELTKQLSLYLKGKNVFVPRDPKIH